MKKCKRCEKDLDFGYYINRIYRDGPAGARWSENEKFFELIVCQKCLKGMIETKETSYSGAWNIEDDLKEFLNNTPKVNK